MSRHLGLDDYLILQKTPKVHLVDALAEREDAVGDERAIVLAELGMPPKKMMQQRVRGLCQRQHRGERVVRARDLLQDLADEWAVKQCFLCRRWDPEDRAYVSRWDRKGVGSETGSPKRDRAIRAGSDFAHGHSWRDRGEQAAAGRELLVDRQSRRPHQG